MVSHRQLAVRFACDLCSISTDTSISKSHGVTANVSKMSGSTYCSEQTARGGLIFSQGSIRLGDYSGLTLWRWGNSISTGDDSSVGVGLMITVTTLELRRVVLLQRESKLQSASSIWDIAVEWVLTWVLYKALQQKTFKQKMRLKK